MKNKPYIIGITGGSGSGKTFFLNSFLKHFTPAEVCLVSQDDYYIQVGVMSAEENKLYNFDLPETIDNQHFLNDIRSILQGKNVHKKEYKFNKKNADVKVLEIKPAPILIIEGLFILHFTEIADLLDLKIFVEADDEIALKRRINRDLTERGYPEPDVRYKWDNHVLPAYQTFLLPYKNNADRIIANNVNEAHHLIEAAKSISDELRSILKDAQP
jgi:uridine kinase